MGHASCEWTVQNAKGCASQLKSVESTSHNTGCEECGGSVCTICNRTVCKRVGMNGKRLHDNRLNGGIALTRNGRNVTNDRHAMNNMSDNSTGSVEMRGRSKRDEELTSYALVTGASRIGISHNARFVEGELRVDFIRQSLGEGGARECAASGGVACLDDEGGNHPVEGHGGELVTGAEGEEIGGGAGYVRAV